MSRQLSQSGSRTYLAGKIISNYGQSTIDCVVRRISDDGATVAVENALGIPERFQLLIADEGNPRPCKLVWQSDKQLGLTFEDEHSAAKAKARPASAGTPVQPDARTDAFIARGVR